MKTPTPITTAAELEAQQLPLVPEGFSVRDERSANWVVRKIVEARQYIRRVEEWAARETRRAQADEKFLLHRFGPQLEDWTRGRLEAESGRRKSISLPSGTLGFRSEPLKLMVSDEDELLRWCRVHLPAAIATVQHVLRNVVKEHIVATGELPHGAEPTDGGEKFYIK
jgi:hypothetical protein